MQSNIYHHLQRPLLYLPKSKNIEFTVAAIGATAKLTRSVIELSSKIFQIPSKVVLFGKGTYFFSVVKFPISVYSCGVSLSKTHKINSFKTACVYVMSVGHKIGLIAMNIFDVLKGMKAFGYLPERFIWVLKPTPLICVIGSVFMAGRLCAQVGEYTHSRSLLAAHQPGQLYANGAAVDDLHKAVSAARLNLIITALDISGVVILSLSTFAAVPVAITGYSLFTISAAVSFSRTVS